MGRLGLLASALSRRALHVAPGEPGEPAWTDGRVVFIDPAIGAREQVRAVAVQASLLAAGSLDIALVRKLKRRPALARRYLAVEGHRALDAIADILPPSVRSLIEPEVAAGAASPEASLAAALRRHAIAAPPECFGVIRARRLLAAANGSEVAGDPQRQSADAAGELAADVDDDGSTGADSLTSAVGSGGALGRVLGRLLSVVRQSDGGAPAGSAAPTHRTHAAHHGRGIELASGVAGAVEDGAVERRGTKYPEWDLHRRGYRPDWCTVQEVGAPLQDDAAAFVPNDYGLRRPLARLAMGLERCHRRMQGDEIDIDAVVAARIGAMAGAAPEETIYIESLRRRRDLAVLLLLDTSGSAAEAAAAGQSIHEQQRAAAAALTVALHQIGDRVALYAYNSRGRSAVHLLPVKRFDEDLSALVMRRLQSLEPGAYSRLGAAIRHGASVLEQRGGTSRRLLVVLSDGLAYDHGYELAYGAADARRALAEARRRGTACLCLSMGAASDTTSLRRVFGSAAHAMIPGPDRLSEQIGPLFRSALRSAEVPRQTGRGR